MSGHGVPVPEAAPNHDIAAGEMLDPADLSEIGLLGRPAELQFTRLAAAYRKQKELILERTLKISELEAMAVDMWDALQTCKVAEQKRNRSDKRLSKELMANCAACRVLLEQLRKLAIRQHLSFEEAGFRPCARIDGGADTPCDCGADRHNEKVDKLIKYMTEMFG